MAVSIFFLLIFRAALTLIVSKSFVLAHARLLLQSPSSTPAIQILFGTVFCDACLENKFTSNSIPLTDAKLRLECTNNLGQTDFSTFLLTNETGQFTAHLPGNLNLTACSARLNLSSHHLQSCNISSSSSSSSSSSPSPAFSIPLTTSHVNFAIKPTKIFTFCPRSEALTLGPPDPPLSLSPFSASKAAAKKQPDSYHLGPPDPPRPTGVVTTSYRLGPPNPPQPRVHN